MEKYMIYGRSGAFEPFEKIDETDKQPNLKKYVGYQLSKKEFVKDVRCFLLIIKKFGYDFILADEILSQPFVTYRTLLDTYPELQTSPLQTSKLQEYTKNT